MGQIIVREPVRPVGVPVALSGLDFPGNVNHPSDSPTMLFVWRDGVSTAPMARSPSTWIQRVFPRDQDGYWSGLFYSHYWPDDGWDAATYRYFGCHPYPDPPETGTPEWEISAAGADITADAVVFEQWYTQVTLINGTTLTYYWDWPDTEKVIVVNDNDGTGVRPEPEDPAIIIGDAPWNVGREVYSGVIRGMQFYDSLLSLAQVQDEIDSPGSIVTPWYLNLNPTPTDIADKSGNGNDPAWVGANRPSLWTE